MRKLSKIIALLLFVTTCAFADWTGSTSEPASMKKIDGKAFYVITTADELAWFAAQVNGGKNDINAVLGNDIVFGKDKNTTGTVNWTPIGKTGLLLEDILIQHKVGFVVYWMELVIRSMGCILKVLI